MKKLSQNSLIIVGFTGLLSITGACSKDTPVGGGGTTKVNPVVTVPKPTTPTIPAPTPTTPVADKCFVKKGSNYNGLRWQRAEAATAAAEVSVISVARKTEVSSDVEGKVKQYGAKEGYEYVSVDFVYTAPSGQFARVPNFKFVDPTGRDVNLEARPVSVPLSPELSTIPPGTSIRGRSNYVVATANLNKGNGSLGKIVLPDCNKEIALTAKSTGFPARNTPASTSDWTPIISLGNEVSARIVGFADPGDSYVQDELRRNVATVALEVEVRNDSNAEQAIYTNITSENFGVVDQSGLSTIQYTAYGPSKTTPLPPGLTKKVKILGGIGLLPDVSLSKKSAVAWLDLGALGRSVNQGEPLWDESLKAQPVIFVGDLP